MPLPLVIRSETEADVGIIFELTEAAFRDMEMSSHTEQLIVGAPAEAGA